MKVWKVVIPVLVVALFGVSKALVLGQLLFVVCTKYANTCSVFPRPGDNLVLFS
jgi:hypothetical protein